MGAQGHDVTGFLPRPNQAKMWSYQGMAHGCESMMYFRYRGATKGAEQFCYGILDADNIKGRKFREVQSFFKDIRNYEKAMESPIRSEVAIVYDYDSLASFRIQRQSILLDCQGEMKKLYKQLENLHSGSNPKKAMRMIRSLLRRESAFAAFKRCYVREHAREYPQLQKFAALEAADNN